MKQKTIKTVRFTFEGEKYRVNVYEWFHYSGLHSQEREAWYAYDLYNESGFCDAGEGYHSVENAVQEAKSAYLGIDY